MLSSGKDTDCTSKSTKILPAYIGRENIQTKNVNMHMRFQICITETDGKKTGVEISTPVFGVIITSVITFHFFYKIWRQHKGQLLE